MKSKWYELKDEVTELRKQGVSMTSINRKYGIPKSTLSGWFKDVKLSEEQRTKLMSNSRVGWQKARKSAVAWHKAQKQLRLKQADTEAFSVYEKIPKTKEVLELALAMLYFGEGAKDGRTSLGSSDPSMIRFFITSLEAIYNVDRNNLRYELHLRDDHDETELKAYWTSELGISPERITYICKDPRSAGKPTKNGYMGVCQVQAGRIAIQRRLKALYDVYCSELINTGT